MANETATALQFLFIGVVGGIVIGLILASLLFTAREAEDNAQETEEQLGLVLVTEDAKRLLEKLRATAGRGWPETRLTFNRTELELINIALQRSCDYWRRKGGDCDRVVALRYQDVRKRLGLPRHPIQ